MKNSGLRTSASPIRSGAKLTLSVLFCATLGACALQRPVEVANQAQLTPATPSTHDLLQLPPPKGPVTVAVYGFRDQTGQYKPAPDSSFSTSVTQGASSMLIKALKDSGWYVPVERESLQELLTERRIVRALDGSQDTKPGEKTAEQSPPAIKIPALIPASILIDGGILSYESNVRTGGLGARFLGVGMSTLYRMDQVTIGLRSVDIRTGKILQTVSTTKTIFSYEVRPSVFKFVNFKDLLEIEGGITQNEPAQLCVKEAIEAAVVHLIVQGIKDGNWLLKNDQDINAPVIQNYMNQEKNYAMMLPPDALSGNDLAGTRVSTTHPARTEPETTTASVE